MGDINLATKMIERLASFPNNMKVDVIKFQKRYPKLILSQKEYNSPHPNHKHSFGKTYGEHRENLEFSLEQHYKLKKICEKHNFIYSSSVFDKVSAEEILTLNPKIIKISSANNTDYDLLKYLDTNFNGEIHISLGMTTRQEEINIIKSFNKNLKNVVLYACTSSYPTLPGDICLLEISRLKNTYGDYIKGVGFSGHHIGYIQDIAAVTLGARYIERHFTLNKSFKGTDQSISLDTNDFFNLIKNVRLVSQDLKLKPTEILSSEQSIRKRLKFGNKNGEN